MAVGFNRNFGSLVLGLTPLVISNGKFLTPKLTIEKAFHDYQISTSVDLGGSISIDYMETANKKYSKSLKLSLDDGSIGLTPKL